MGKRGVEALLSFLTWKKQDFVEFFKNQDLDFSSPAAVLGDGVGYLWVLLPWCCCSGRTPSMAPLVWGMGCGLCHGPAAALS